MKGSINILNNYSESPIHIAIRLSQETVLKLLLDKGADSKLLCGDLCPVHVAMRSNSKGCLKVLFEHDAKCIFDADKKYGAGPLHWARYSEVNPIIKV